MRRYDREITDRAMLDRIIREALVCHLGLSDAGRPYIVPLSYGYDGRYLYFHTAPAGRKLDILAANPAVCFEVEHEVHVIPDAERACGWGMSFYSVMGEGVVTEITAPGEKLDALNCIMMHYSGHAWEISEDDIGPVRTWRLEIAEMTGKRSKDKPA